MSYQEKRTLVSIITGIFVTTGYALYVTRQISLGADAGDLKFWAGAILLFIGIGILAAILIQIIFHILLSIAIAVQEKIKDQTCDDQGIEQSIHAEIIEDEMDKLIALKSMWVGFAFAGVGFVASLISLLLNYTPVVMLNLMFVSFSVGSIFEGFTQLYYYRKGI